MGANNYRPHIVVLPEDDANGQLANGFALQLSDSSRRQFKIEPVAGGWSKTRALFQSDHVSQMAVYKERFVVLIVDFDEDADRLQAMRAAIPDDISERVFVIGVWSEPEALKRRQHESLEKIGKALADECRDNRRSLWDHDLLRHNAEEVVRFQLAACQFLFP